MANVKENRFNMIWRKKFNPINRDLDNQYDMDNFIANW